MQKRTYFRKSFLLVGDGGFGPPKSKDNRFTVCPLWPLGNTPTKKWSWWTDLNPRPADYKSAALPAELHQRFSLYSLECLYIITQVFEKVKRFLKSFLRFFQKFFRSVMKDGKQ